MQKLPEYDAEMEEKRREAEAANEVCGWHPLGVTNGCMLFAKQVCLCWKWRFQAIYVWMRE